MTLAASPLLFPHLRKAREFLAWIESTTGINIQTARRTREITQAKWAVWLVLRHWGLGTSEIGRLTQHHHSTVLHGIASGRQRAAIVQLGDAWLAEFEAMRVVPPRQELLISESIGRPNGADAQRTTPPGARSA